jgi:LmbE family N-acetylglucosaminyl deacetylase
MKLNHSKILVLAPHTDDGELGCGGTIARFAEADIEIHYVAFSICEISVPEDFPPDILATEVKQAAQVLDITSQNLSVYRYPVRNFPQYRQEILDKMIVLKQKIRPDLVFLPSTDDVHQDHQVIAQEGIRAFKYATILGYELPWNNFQFTPAALVSLESQHLEKKLEAIQAYKSQRHRNYIQPEFIESLARVRGKQAGGRYAEAFQVIRWMIK